MENYFTVENDDQLKLLKTFFKTDMPSVRFIENPYKYSNGRYRIAISCNVSDGNKLSAFMASLETKELVVQKEGIFKRMLKMFGL